MEQIRIGILFILGMGVFGGILGASLFNRLKIPQVVGYIVIGLILGDSVLGIIQHKDVVMLRTFNLFALGIIGFMVGGELKLESFKKYGKQFFLILLGEGLLSFTLVFISTTIILYFVIGNLAASFAAGIVFGAIASATDPASTVDVLWEERAKGILTTTIVAIVALDDALAMTLYGLGTGAAKMITGESASILGEMLHISIELFGAISVGVISAIILNYIMRSPKLYEKRLPIAVGTILLIISVASYFKMDVILATISLGCVITNLAPRRSEQIFDLMRNFSSPIYVMFFVLVGARLNIGGMPHWIWLIVVAYIVCRSLGKVLGSYLGAKRSGAEACVRKYTGLSLFAQGGIAVGLSIMASQHLSHIQINDNLNLGDLIIFAVTATTFIVQLLGPPLVKLSIKLANEIGKDLKEEDIIADLFVKDVMCSDIIKIFESTPLPQVVKIFSDNDYLYYPVINKEGKLIGGISLEELRYLLSDHTWWQWLLASDMTSPVNETVFINTRLDDALSTMHNAAVEHLVVLDPDTKEVNGLMIRHNVEKRISEELIKRRSKGEIIPVPIM